MYNSIPQKEYRIPQRNSIETNRATKCSNARSYEIACRVSVCEDLGDIVRVRNMDILIPQKGYRIPQKRKNEL